MKKVIFLALTLTFISQVNAQNINLPPNPKQGKCYKQCFDYNKKSEWKEVDCEKIKAEKNRKKTKKELAKIEQKKLKLKQYQEKLKQLGYNVDITGIADEKTIIAHHQYLKRKQK